MVRFWIIFGAFLMFLCSCDGHVTYLGCYHDNNNNLDLSDSSVSFSELQFDVGACVNQCRITGSPYAGIRAAQTCYCGRDYGSHGPAPTACNYTCDGAACGGNAANSIYYVPDPDEDVDRQLWAHGIPLSYPMARRECVRTNGDLAALRHNQSLNDSLSLFADFYLPQSQKKFWLGLQHECGVRCDDTGNQCSGYNWVNPNMTFDCDSHASEWQSDETWGNPCVAVDMATGKWQTTNCYAQYPYLCFSVEEGDYAIEDTGGYVILAAKPVDTTQTRKALFIVLPFFFFCYGGSCLLYCLHKAYKSCRRGRRKHMLLEREESFEEYEPEMKPQWNSVVGWQNRASVGPVIGGEKQDHHVVCPVMDREKQGHPVVGPVMGGEKPGSYPMKQKPILMKKESAHSLTPSVTPSVTSSQLATSEAIRIDMNSPNANDGSERNQKINERRRVRLLQNALQEARKRRALEHSDGAVDQSWNPPTPGEPLHKVAKPSIYSPRDRPRDPLTSSRTTLGSMASLMVDGRRVDSPDDPTMMSIADIMRVKEMMKEKKRRVRKILLS